MAEKEIEKTKEDTTEENSASGRKKRGSEATGSGRIRTPLPRETSGHL